ncbi:MAG: hypothetical protein QW304_07220 [Thermoproteota archaeon]
MPAEDHENLHSDMDRILEMIIQAKLLYAVTPRVPEYMKTLLIIRPKSNPRGYSLLVKETYEAYRRSRV